MMATVRRISTFATLCLVTISVAEGWIWTSSRLSAPSRRRQEAALFASECSDDGQSPKIPDDIKSAIQNIAVDLWGGQSVLDKLLTVTGGIDPLQGEMKLPSNIPITERYAYFLEKAERGDARAQHSVGLLLWNGFGLVGVDPEASARWHAAAAVQENFDALAVFGGCLRTGTGVGKHNKNIALGLKCIEYAASIGNPSGVNKKAALLESNDDWSNAAHLYERHSNDKSTRNNALLLFNWGYCLVNGNGVGQDIRAGETRWKEAVDMAPDEGSEEAAYFLYEQYARDDIGEARKWLEISAELGYQEAMELV